MLRTTNRFLKVVILLLLSIQFAHAATEDLDTQTDFETVCQNADAEGDGRVVCADLAALDQTLIYNRFGSYNPFGMIFALRRDLVPMDSFRDTPLDAEYCSALLGTETYEGNLSAGAVRLKDCKRPRPVVLRVNVGDTLLIHVSNFLKPDERVDEFDGNVVDFSDDFCPFGPSDDENYARAFNNVTRGDNLLVKHGERACPPTNSGAAIVEKTSDWPNTRGLTLLVQGLMPRPDPVSGEIHGACAGTSAVSPDDDFWCEFLIPQEGTYFFASTAAPAGGEGSGGSLVHGLFGAVLAEKAGSRWYRSQTTSAAFNAVWPENNNAAVRHARTGLPDYEKTDENSAPILNMAMPLDGVAQSDFNNSQALEIVHSDLNAIIFCDETAPNADCRPRNDGDITNTTEPAYRAFREFSVFFHDELKTFYNKNFQELAQLGQLAGVGDGFAINYGASGMGAMLLANRKGFGPASECMECLYEEFFLTSWANGDPALLEWFADDPSNVHHSYMNDPVNFRNFHAGPKETHVFHLHAHQWFAGNDPNRGTYLDSQTVAPQQGFTYNIYHGGLRDQNGAGDGWWDTQGSGNRNRTVGDSIFHCHLYPHFAQGMWALWRVHDVLEDGTRVLPDGQANPGLSLDFEPQAERLSKRFGSVDRETGAWLDEQKGTPIPAVIPLPGEALPLLPTYAQVDDDEATPLPGYPFYIAGEAGHRPPQAPLDIARNLGDNPGLDAQTDARLAGEEWLDGGMGRHIVKDGSARKLGIKIAPSVASTLQNPDALDNDARAGLMSQIVTKSFALGDLSAHLTSANIEILDNNGTTLERAAMGFHFNGELFDPDDKYPVDSLHLRAADGSVSAKGAGEYASLTAPMPNGAVNTGVKFYVNGSAPKPGAPFADPCGAPLALENTRKLGFDPLMRGQNDLPYGVDPRLIGFRRYEASAVQLDLIVNQAGWHDPQARINVLTARSDSFKDATRPESISPVISDKEEPFFFRAISGECIEFRHTNELPKELALDDFQVKTPTDTIGQHIHLVKFDVTASDGSGNGWNYEDGTFAPDEIAARRCATTKGELEGTLQREIADGECVNGEPVDHDIWRLPLSENRDKFQTTVQRWFSDPILSRDENAMLRDRTMRTVFTHDHFGPSSIQQHGFYSALVIEPGVDVSEDTPKATLGKICEGNSEACDEPLGSDEQFTSVAWGGDVWEGTHKRITLDPPDPVHPDYREFALSIADFATLYDPRDRSSVNDFRRDVGIIGVNDADTVRGMPRLYCEALWRRSPFYLDSICGNNAKTDETLSWYLTDLGNLPPAWLATGRNRDDVHAPLYFGDIFVENLRAENEVADLRDYIIAYREKAAGLYGTNAGNGVKTMANPVAPPLRPESISVDHHDPYLVNYRGAPIPLRIGNKRPGNVQSSDCAPMDMNRAGDHNASNSEVMNALLNGDFPLCSFQYQVAGKEGDMSGALSSRLHGDPETPVFEAYQNERLMFRMIQGAQEVQHSFILYGQPHKRNIDQAFGRGMQPLGMTTDFANSMHQACFEANKNGRPAEYLKWLNAAPKRMAGRVDVAYWTAYEKLLAECDNIEGFMFAQEIGISEHFEIRGSLRSDVAGSLETILHSEIESALTNERSNFSDFLYSFGSVDAIWNGAWGLLRIYKDPESIDPNTNPDFASNSEESTPVPVGSRLYSVADAAAGNDEGAGVGDPSVLSASAGSGLSCPLPREDGDELNIVEAVIVAIETREIWSEGTDYGGGRRDPDGLMFALLSPQALGKTDIADTGWENLNEAEVKTAISNTYVNGPEPMVLRAKAGECLRLRFVNLLKGGDAGLRDALGDARMPPIAPLNTDPAGSKLGAGVRIGTLSGTAQPNGLRPSANLAVSVGLPSLNLIEDMPLGFGYYQKSALLSVENGKVAVSDILSFYAGRFRIDPDATDEILLGDMIEIYGEYLHNSSIQISGGAMFPQNSNAIEVATLPKAFMPNRDALFELLGQEYIMVLAPGIAGSPLPQDGFIPENSGDNAAQLVSILCDNGDTDCETEALAWHQNAVFGAQVSALYALDENTHWIPYAFGAVPVTSVSDIVSHTVSGLFGMIDVVPENWQFVDLPAPEAIDVDIPFGTGEATYHRRFASHNAVSAEDWDNHLGDGVPQVFTVEHNGETKTIREFALFYQDGLNLWDDESDIIWRWENGRLIRNDANEVVKMVPECLVCDDSYDLGEAGVNYRSAAYANLLRTSDHSVEENDDFNVSVFPADYMATAPNALRLQACEDEQIVIRVMHPGGRARQRAFAMNGYTYDDIFPGFGFPRSTLLAPGKSMTAWLYPEAKEGTALWHDGPAQIRAAGVWGLLETKASGDALCAN